MKIPAKVQTLFWDTDKSRIDFRQNKNFIISRLADKGNLAAVNWLKKIYGVKAIKKAVSQSRNVSAKTKSFWRLI